MNIYGVFLAVGSTKNWEIIQWNIDSSSEFDKMSNW